MCTSQLTSVLFIYLKLEVYFFGKKFVTIFNSTLISFLSNSFFMHRRCKVTYDQISAVSFNENKHAHQLQTGLMRYIILKLHGNETRNSCEQRVFFLSALCASLTWLCCEPSVSIRKKYPLEPGVLAWLTIQHSNLWLILSSMILLALEELSAPTSHTKVICWMKKTKQSAT